MVVFLVTYQTPNANKQPQEQQQKQQDLLVGLGDMPGNHGGTPEGNYGQHDCRGDLQGQTDLFHKVSTPKKLVLDYIVVVFYRVFDVASQDLYTMGIMVVSYTIKDVSDEVRDQSLFHSNQSLTGWLLGKSWTSEDCRSQERCHHW